ncbi:hypothetical protein [Fulvivirga sediminis]|uniref:Uncharacterized protein n=1 Tax=Fulvivirga sediminis TaxID=2803949 RepID=A0A937K1H9_9BACT|nr:hypothetical protein [Fulvivirga sediminis]MBL3657355.1 hypothetical protein [Fulvivirga sediminis]
MDQNKAYSLLNRQLTDILANAERIIKGSDSTEEVETFARYSTELKRFVNERIENKDFVQMTNDIPTIEYKRMRIQLWHYFIWPSWFLIIYKNYYIKLRTIEQIQLARSKYASLQVLTKSQIN